MKRNELIHFLNTSYESKNELKSAIQTHFINTWLREYDGIGYGEAFTGFGKGYMIETVIKRFKTRTPDGTIIIVVPSEKIYADFKAFIEQEKYNNIYLYVINTYTMSDADIVKECDLLLIDELHKICGENAKYFSTVLDITKYKRLLGVSATLSDKDKEFLEDKGISQCFSISLYEGNKLDLLPEYEILNVGVSLTEKEKEEYAKLDDAFQRSFKIFHNLKGVNSFSIAMACSFGENSPVKVNINGQSVDTTSGKLRKYVASNIGLSIDVVKACAMEFRKKMAARNKIIDNAENKYNFHKKLILELAQHTNKRSISFCNSIDTVIKMQEDTHNIALAYHSKIGKKKRTEIFKSFTQKGFNHILTISALDEGTNVKSIDVAINSRYDRTVRKMVQRTGRALRLDEENPNKKSYMVYIYCKPYLYNMENIYPSDVKTLNKIQENAVGVNHVTMEQCLEILKN